MDYPHYNRIKKLCFISKSASGISQIGCLDDFGIISIWNIAEVSANTADYELNLCLGGKFKMVLSYTDNLLSHITTIDDDLDHIAASLEVEFDPIDTLVFYFSTSTGLYKLDKHEESDVPVKLDTTGLSAPTALSMSDKGFLLASFSCGSICIFDKDYSIPLTVWYHTTEFPLS